MTTQRHGAERFGLIQWSVQMGCYPPSWMCQRRKSGWTTSGLTAPQLCSNHSLGQFHLAEPWLSVMGVYPHMGIVWVRWMLSPLPSGWQEVIITAHYSIDQGLSGALWLQWSNMYCVTVTIAIVLAAIAVNGGSIAGSSCLYFQPGSSLQVQRTGPGGCCGPFRVTVAYIGPSWERVEVTLATWGPMHAQIA